jgi:hypothetical protein
VLAGYCKGTPDILEALVLSPEIHDHAATSVSIHQAVHLRSIVSSENHLMK